MATELPDLSFTYSSESDGPQEYREPPPADEFYDLKFVGVRPFDGPYGASVILQFEVATGEHEGKPAEMLVRIPRVMNDKAGMTKVAEAFVGRPLEEHERFALLDYVGEVRRGLVEHRTASNKKVYGTVTKLQAPKKKAAKAAQDEKF